ncbi:MAG: GIY-YIG nuclease family protein [Leptolyngbyaceae cyanobacterium RM2_2_4]|nr:GIY-YIG nuclease family protein [Leptolyngbyaceae cyanobacterium SM1_4_3]NJN90764.1 GIY-YIG nuclease family protein [Leptolyngbyaceae cyanobacterium SL_5_14]NJO52513.1 GIY-YIG nuclease family protein [Leptolyngbyaceae cyanobacterium RM2_2_4]NJO67195.1 GIY-YIG nuclease family protein [Leptolyngbyaceae cyanobacterium RM1_405_57]
MSDDQLLLFPPEDLRGCRSVERQEGFLEMGCAALQSWKQRIFQYQRRVKISPAAEQRTLFDAVVPGLAQLDPKCINPFSLPQQNTEFWRWKAADQGTAALYFVIDYELPILLYVGETVKSNQRWKGVHDCKRYLLNYRQAHYRHQLTSMLGIAFWAEAPVATRPRQRLESALIEQWRSPFNKENWDFWATPFVGGK